MNNKTIINGKAWIAGLAMFASAIPATVQETVEIRYTRDDFSHTIEVNRDIWQLDLDLLELTSVPWPKVWRISINYDKKTSI